MVIGVIAGYLVAQLQKKKHSGRKLYVGDMARIIHIIALIPFIVTAVFVFYYYWKGTISIQTLLLWQNPILLAATYAGAVLAAAGRNSDNPYGRQFSRGVVPQSLVLLIAVIVGSYFPDYFHQSSMQYALLITIILFSATGVFGLVKAILSLEVETFSSLEKRYDLLTNSMTQVQNEAFLIGGSTEWETIRDAMTEAQKLSQAAQHALRHNDLRSAGAALVQAETEVAHIESLIKARLRMSLPDALNGRFAQAHQDLASLRQDFELAALSAAHLDELETTLFSLKEKASQFTGQEADATAALQEYHKFFLEIAETRTALRFRRNVDNKIVEMKGEVDRLYNIRNIFPALALDSEAIDSAYVGLTGTIDKFRTGSVQSARELVDTYQALQGQRASFESLIAERASLIDRLWFSATLGVDMVDIFVPKVCSSTKAAHGAIRARFNQGCDKITVGLVGTLLDDVPSEIVIEPDRPVEAFSFVGKKGGQGTLRARIRNGRHQDSDRSFDVTVTESGIETTQHSLAIGAALAAIIGMGLWWQGQEVDIAGPIGGVAGLSVAVVTFLYRYLKYRQ
jgi:hypothetical protein